MLHSAARWSDLHYVLFNQPVSFFIASEFLQGLIWVCKGSCFHLARFGDLLL